jgi:peptidyl-prolyl cis-trans isomerase C
MSITKSSKINSITHNGLVFMLIGMIISTISWAETVKTINGTDIDSLVLDIYIQSRTQQPATGATPDQRLLYLDELTDIYLLSTQESAIQLSENPQIKAQIELQNRGLIAQAVASDFFVTVNVSEEQILSEYNQVIQATPSKEYMASHILLETQSEAISIIEKLNNGEVFSELATTNSIGPSANAGGSLGTWFSPNQMVKPFSDAVATLDDGSYTADPIQTEFGWHVILRENSRDSIPPTLDSVSNEIRQKIIQDEFQAYLETLK